MGLKVVIVDDSSVVTKRVQSILTEMRNIEFLGSAGTFLSALDLISKQAPDVVILDINLDEKIPHPNRIDLLIRLRHQYPGMKIIMFTNLSSPPYRVRCLEFGANYFLDKSNDFYRIPETLEAIAQAAQTNNKS